MEAPVQRHHPDSLVLARGGHDGVPADGAPWGEPPVKVLDTVDLVGGVHGEGDPVQALGADHAREAAGVVGLACSPQYSVQNWLETLTAPLQCAQIVSLTQGLPIHCIEWQSLQSNVAF